jgi:hypothetical protein
VSEPKRAPTMTARMTRRMQPPSASIVMIESSDNSDGFVY